MKIIDWKVYKEIKLKELDKEELLEIIEDLQKRVDKLENRWYNWLTWVSFEYEKKLINCTLLIKSLTALFYLLKNNYDKSSPYLSS